VYDFRIVDSPAAVRFTYADYQNLPEESRYEILDGDLIMSPSPTKEHQQVVLRLVRALAAYVESNNLGEVFVAPYDVVLSETDVVQPDILFISKQRASIATKKAVMGAPDLVIEVLSPGTSERDRTVKAKLYARAGVKELWLVDPETRAIQVLKNGPQGFEPQESGTTATSEVVSGFNVAAEQIF
jgi:Uma2 family endonuclease